MGGVRRGRPLRHRAGRGWLTALPVLAAVLMLLAGCSGGAKPGLKPAAKTAGSPSASPAHRMLRLVVPPGYVEDGSTNPGVNWVRDFQEGTGCRVELTDAPTDSAAVHDITAHGSLYDGVLASPEAAGQLIGARAVAPLQVSRITGYQSIETPLRSAPGLRPGGAVYGMPYLWDSYVVGYDSGQVNPPPRNWAAIFGPASASRYPGKILLPGTPVTIALAALYLKSAQPSLGISDPFELDPAQFDAALGAIDAVRHDVSTFWAQDATVIGQLGDGQDVIGAVMTHQVSEMTRAGLAAASVPVPAASGAAMTVGYVESWLISRHAPDPGCMYQWLSWSNSRYVQERASAWTGLAPVTPAGCAGPARAICAAYHEPSLAPAGNIVFEHLPVRGCGTGHADCMPYSRWVSAWRKFVPSFQE